MRRRSRTPAFRYVMHDQGGLANSHISSLRKELLTIRCFYPQIRHDDTVSITNSYKRKYALSVDFNVREFIEQTYEYHVLRIEA